MLGLGAAFCFLIVTQQLGNCSAKSNMTLLVYCENENKISKLCSEASSEALQVKNDTKVEEFVAKCFSS